MKAVTEEDIRLNFAERLRYIGWNVYEEMWLTRLGSHYRADIIGRHFEYNDLGWFLFELKKPIGNFAESITKVHKQIVYRYIGSQINDYRYPTIKDYPKVFVYCYPYSYSNITSHLKESMGALMRFFNRYGIGLLFSDEKHIIFNPNDPHWAKLHLDPAENSQWFDLSRLTKYLRARTFSLT